MSKKIVQLNEEVIKSEIKELVRGSLGVYVNVNEKVRVSYNKLRKLKKG